jgi:hypothetical protein
MQWTTTNNSEEKEESLRTACAPTSTPQQWLLCHMGLYYFEFEFKEEGGVITT